MGRRRSQRACASAPSMLSSSRGSPELRRGSASDPEVSAGAEGAAGSEAAPPGERGGRTRGGGRGSAAAAASTGEAEGAEPRGDTPARKPDPEAGRMDHHQPGTGRYQVVSARAPGEGDTPRPPPPGHPRRGPAALPVPARPFQPPAAADGLLAPHQTPLPSPTSPTRSGFGSPPVISFLPDSDTRETLSWGFLLRRRRGCVHGPVREAIGGVTDGVGWVGVSAV